MNTTETMQCLGRLSAAFPNVQLPEATVHVWAEHLASYRPDDGLAACRLVEQTYDWFPTLKQFRDAIQAAARNRIAADAPPALAEDYGPPTPPDKAQANIVRLRQTLAAHPIKRLA